MKIEKGNAFLVTETEHDEMRVQHKFKRLRGVISLTRI